MERLQRFCWVNVSKADQNRVPSLTCVRLELSRRRLFQYLQPMQHDTEKIRNYCILMAWEHGDLKTDINTYDVGGKRCHTNCSVLRTFTILPNIRIS